MVLSAGFGSLAGDAVGDSTRHCKCLQLVNDKLTDELEKARSGEQPLPWEFKQQRGIINDIHRQISAVTGGLEKRPS